MKLLAQIPGLTINYHIPKGIILNIAKSLIPQDAGMRIAVRVNHIRGVSGVTRKRALRLTGYLPAQVIHKIMILKILQLPGYNVKLFISKLFFFIRIAEILAILVHKTGKFTTHGLHLLSHLPNLIKINRGQGPPAGNSAYAQLLSVSNSGKGFIIRVFNPPYFIMRISCPIQRYGNLKVRIKFQDIPHLFPYQIRQEAVGLDTRVHPRQFQTHGPDYLHDIFPQESLSAGKTDTLKVRQEILIPLEETGNIAQGELIRDAFIKPIASLIIFAPDIAHNTSGIAHISRDEVYKQRLYRFTQRALKFISQGRNQP